jgi:hypothetical protein
VPGGAGDARIARCRARGAALIARWEPRARAVSAASTRIATIRSPRAGSPRRGSRPMAASLRRSADAVGAPMGLVLEGGLRPWRAGALDGRADAGAD